MVPLNEVATISFGTRVTKKRDAGTVYPVYGGGGATFALDEFNRDNCFIVSRFGMSEECVRFVRGKFFLNDSGLTVDTIDNYILDQRFLDHFLFGTQKKIYEFGRGTAQKNLNVSAFKEMLIPLPRLDQQKRIVALLDQALAALDRAFALAEANLAAAREFLESFVEQELSRSDGEILSLQELLDSGAITGHLDGNHGSDYPRKEEFVETGIPYISANCMVDQRVDIEQAKFLSEERASRMRKGVAQDRDVLFAHNATVGPVALLRTNLRKIILSTSLTYYRCNSDKVLPEFLVYEMRGANFRRQYESVMRQATRNQVPITAQRKFVHVIPSIAEQRRIMERCAEIEVLSRRLVEQYSNEIRDLASLRQSLLQKAFSGELT